MATDPNDKHVPPPGDPGTHPLAPTRPEVPEHAQPKSMQSHPGAVPETEDHVVAHEESDVNIRAIATFIIVLFGAGAVISAALVGLMAVYADRSTQADPAVSPLAVPAGTLPPEPRLLTDEPGALRQVRSEEEAQLAHIEEAKQSVVGKLPARAGTTAPAQSPARGMSRMDTSSGRRQ
jgi:hypothetical protein